MPQFVRELYLFLNCLAGVVLVRFLEQCDHIIILKIFLDPPPKGWSHEVWLIYIGVQKY